MRLRRVVVLGTLAAVAIAVVAPPAGADDLSDYLEEADLATYSGRRMVGTNWDGWERMEVVDVEQLGGMAMIGSGPGFWMLGAGKFHADQGVAIAYEHDDDSSVTHRYVTVRGETSMHLGRAAQVVEITEDDRVRMRMVVDVATAAPLATEVYDAEGNLFRYSTMVEFSDTAPAMVDYHDYGDYDVMVPVDEVLAPPSAGAYDLLDAYGGFTGQQQAFYTDGLFGFSLFVIEGQSDVTRMTDEGRTWDVDGYRYLRVVQPAEVWILWSTDDTTYALVGDLPPDHMSDVLADLPRPPRRNWFQRFWNNLFG